MITQKEAMMAQVKQELALANAQELINKISEKCYSRCIPKPGDKIGYSEEGCLARCMDRYMEAFNVVHRTYYERLARERREQEFKD
ncbi:Tim10/DDP family zinc finger-domain-containing protein [Auriculariales sp. MPI-PUGE-AT-0066]|nr:Tim10/DDP family zinc finger-domain-containing protein [Auriculariales sp. MPI-PUGE-AT-0066]